MLNFSKSIKIELTWYTVAAVWGWHHKPHAVDEQQRRRGLKLHIFDFLSQDLYNFK